MKKQIVLASEKVFTLATFLLKPRDSIARKVSTRRHGLSAHLTSSFSRNVIPFVTLSLSRARDIRAGDGGVGETLLIVYRRIPGRAAGAVRDRRQRRRGWPFRER